MTNASWVSCLLKFCLLIFLSFLSAFYSPPPSSFPSSQSPPQCCVSSVSLLRCYPPTVSTELSGHHQDLYSAWLGLELSRASVSSSLFKSQLPSSYLSTFMKFPLVLIIKSLWTLTGKEWDHQSGSASQRKSEEKVNPPGSINTSKLSSRMFVGTRGSWGMQSQVHIL